MIPHNRPTISADEEAAASRVLRSRMVAQSKEVESFENELCDFLKLPQSHAVALSSGSAALYVALKILRAEGQTVHQPLYTCASLAHATKLAGGVAKFVDVETVNVSPQNITQIGGLWIAPHMFGLPIDLTQTQASATVIEDVCQALGSEVKGRMAGTLGKVGILSFYATKLFTTGGQGGALVSQDLSLVEAARDFRNFDCREDQKFRFNFQMTDLQAAIGRSQLKSFPQFLRRREEIYQKYKQANLPLIDSEDKNLKPVRFRAIVRIAPDRQKKLIEYFRAEDISIIVPIEERELMASAISYPKTLEWTRITLSLPIYPSLTDSEVDKVIETWQRAQ